jgi:hypothetical protein
MLVWRELLCAVLLPSVLAGSIPRHVAGVAGDLRNKQVCLFHRFNRFISFPIGEDVVSLHGGLFWRWCLPCEKGLHGTKHITFLTRYSV